MPEHKLSRESNQLRLHPNDLILTFDSLALNLRWSEHFSARDFENLSPLLHASPPPLRCTSARPLLVLAASHIDTLSRPLLCHLHDGFLKCEGARRDGGRLRWKVTRRLEVTLRPGGVTRPRASSERTHRTEVFGAKGLLLVGCLP